MSQPISVKIKETRRIIKYDEGSEEPFEVIEREHVLEGDEALQLLAHLRGDETNAID